MTLIDQRILIDAPPQVVWNYISDPARLTSWNTGYTNVSVLTTQQAGAGTRRRCTPANGQKDLIEEITHWVDGWGYEYTVVDGGPYRQFQGRLRLQAVPDGTSVQWTISYRPKGPLGLIRDRLSGRRAVIAMMAASLRQLRRRIDELGVRMDDDTRARVGMQGRLNVEERAHYQRRHAPPPDLAAPEGALATGEPAADLPAPPPEAPAEIPAGPVPSFVADLTRGLDEPDYASTADTEPRPPKGLREAIQAQQDAAPGRADVPPQAASPTPEPPPAEVPPPVVIAPPADITPPPEPAPPAAPAVPAAPDALPDYRRPTPPRGIPVVKPAASPAPLPADSRPDGPFHPPAPAVLTTPGQAAAPVEPPAPHPVTPSREMPRVESPRRPDLPPPTPATDTGEISIWEVFGLKRPSEQDTAALNDLIQAVETRKKKDARRAQRGRARRPVHVRQVSAAVGLRLRLALHAVRVRLGRAVH